VTEKNLPEINKLIAKELSARDLNCVINFSSSVGVKIDNPKLWRQLL